MEEKVCELWQMYRQGASYMRALHLPETVRQNVRFYEGDQWAPPYAGHEKYAETRGEYGEICVSQ